MSSKGGAYERELSTKLSLWWSNGKRDDLIWRTSTSGGRATIRGKKGKRTFGSYGDLHAVDPLASDLFLVFTIEAKRGYTGASFADAIDRPVLAKQTTFEAFCEQARTAAVAAGSASWMLIQRRDKKRALCFIPRKAFSTIQMLGGCDLLPCPYIEMRLNLRQEGDFARTWVVAMQLDDFLRTCSPDVIRRFAEKVRPSGLR